MKPPQLKHLSNLCFVLGSAPIIGSIAIVFLTGGQAHGERYGLLVGQCAPKRFILSNRFDRHAERVA